MPTLLTARFEFSVAERGVDARLEARQGPPSGWTGGPPPWVTGTELPPWATATGPPPWVTVITSPPASSTQSTSSSTEPSSSSMSASSPPATGDNAATEVESSSSSSTPIGAIVGGVLAALAVAVGAILLWWFLRRRRARQTTNRGSGKVSSAISPFRTDFERQQQMQQVSGRGSPPPRNSFQTTSTLMATSPSSQKGYQKSIPSVQRSASTAGSLSTNMEGSTSIMSPISATTAGTENPQVLQAIRTLQTFLQPHMERIPESNSGIAAAAARYAEPPSPPPPAYEESSTTGDGTGSAPHRSSEKTRIENQ